MRKFHWYFIWYLSPQCGVDVIYILRIWKSEFKAIKWHYILHYSLNSNYLCENANFSEILDNISVTCPTVNQHPPRERHCALWNVSDTKRDVIIHLCHAFKKKRKIVRKKYLITEVVVQNRKSPTSQRKQYTRRWRGKRENFRLREDHNFKRAVKCTGSDKAKRDKSHVKFSERAVVWFDFGNPRIRDLLEEEKDHW